MTENDSLTTSLLKKEILLNTSINDTRNTTTTRRSTATSQKITLQKSLSIQSSLFTVSNYSTMHELNEDHRDPTVLRWNNLKLSVKNPKNKNEDLTIINGISGYANKGELLGIVGASGGGKTTLLSMLSGRILKIESLQSNSKREGRIQYKKFVGDCSDSNTFRVLSDNVAMVLQEDYLIGQEKVKEALLTSSLLRSRKPKRKDKIKMANRILKELDLEKVSDSYIGNEAFRGVSGGEKKRVSIGCELVTNPHILLLDEPTTGLDSNSAYDTIKLLKKLSTKEKCVICTIHSPSSEVFELLDRIMVLAKGEVVFSGPTKEMVPYLKGIGYNVPKYSNVCDYMLQEIHYNPDSFIQHWKTYTNEDDTEEKKGKITTLVTKVPSYSFYMAPIYIQLFELLRRNCKVTFRNKQLVLAKVFEMLFRSILIGLIWYREKNLIHYDSCGNCECDLMGTDQCNTDTYEKGITNCQDRFGAIFYACFGAIFNSIMTAILIFPQEKIIFSKERASNWYYSVIWLVTKWFFDVPIIVFINIISSVILKYLVNFNASIIEICICVTLLGLVGDSYGLLMGTVAKTLHGAVASIPMSVIPMMLLSGFMINIKNIPVYLNWYRWINPVWYASNIWAVKEYDYGNNSVACCYGNEFKDLFTIRDGNYWRNIYIMLILFGGYRLIAVTVLVIRHGL